MKTVPEIALTAMQGDMTRMSATSSNIANALTPAYQRQVVVQRGIPGVSFSNQVDGLTTELKVQNDPRPGTLKSTSNRLDVALVSAGFFEVDTPQGPAYTRAGAFQVDARGRLVTAQGYPVMGKGGEIHLTTQTPTIDAQGAVSEGGRVVGNLKVVRFEAPQNLMRLGNGLYQGGTESMVGSVMSESQIEMRQGYLENSNVTHVHEMVQMMQTLRHFESMQRAAQSYDDMLGTAIRKLGEF
ncbi:MAG: hypothetical protein RIR70_684 [Pseudomonadota bacterium]|jgi:flagellar basal-body rod protein FlgG